jgi:hypothetical protein
LLKGTQLFLQSASAGTAGEVVAPYAAATELSIADLLELFEADGWRPRFGGKKWAAIVQTAQTLITAVDVGDWKGANVVCDQIAVIEHNSGPLVPSLSEWTEQARLKEKWPQLCG